MVLADTGSVTSRWCRRPKTRVRLEVMTPETARLGELFTLDELLHRAANGHGRSWHRGGLSGRDVADDDWSSRGPSVNGGEMDSLSLSQVMAARLLGSADEVPLPSRGPLGEERSQLVFEGQNRGA